MATPPAAEALAHAVPRLAGALAAVDAADPELQNRTRQRLFDTLAATAIGHATPEGRALGRSAGWSGVAMRGPERCRQLVGATRTTEIDDIDIASCTTVGAVIVPTTLCVAAMNPACDGKTLLGAIVAGYEAMIRLGRAIGGATLLYEGVWPTLVTAPFGAAAATARLLSLDAQATARALALALSQTGLPPRRALARFGYRYHALGGAAQEGCAAAFAAAAGIDADLDGLASYGERLGTAIDAAALTAGLGGTWRIREVDSKMFPSSRQALASVAAFLEPPAAARDIADLTRIDVYVPRAYRGMIDRPQLPTQRIESMIGVQYQIALAALAPETLHDALRATLPGSTAVTELMSKIHVHDDVELSKRFPASWGSRIELSWNDGRTTSAEVAEPPGSGRRELDWQMLEHKAQRIHAASGGDAAALPDLRVRCEAVGAGSSGDAEALLRHAETLTPKVKS